MVQHDDQPVYDIDKIFASLTLAEAPDAEGRKPLPETPPRTPTHTPRKQKVSSPEQSTSASISYSYASPTRSGHTQDWAHAAHVTQGTPESRVQCIGKRPKTRTKKAAYVVFRGRTIGVFRVWQDVQQATSGLPFALHQGYTTQDLATAAFDFAERRGWTAQYTASLFTVPLTAPLPIPEALHAPKLFSSPLATRRVEDSWFVVYAGIHPGVFPTSIECALNVLGIEASVHESAATYALACEKFRHAKERGEVHVRGRQGHV
ncbi:hypothetical protein B0H17DRAFT_1149970 [Mycena rosella]|uniref:Ribonuclease H1 N-terminal domain-containing protein n=1 Tax=Mycena rosella TaxID=1033263 RepID=A0AAD7BWV0_MYCRO|nr:hypothetical protein B0H17DRAFT_1149970 [Mycena rosella]